MEKNRRDPRYTSMNVWSVEFGKGERQFSRERILFSTTDTEELIIHKQKSNFDQYIKINSK